MVDAGLLRASLHTLFDQMDKIWGAEFAEARETFCSRVDSESDVVILDDPIDILSVLRPRD